MTEREMRDREKLVTVDDYFNAIEDVSDLTSVVENDIVDKTLLLLIKGLYKKYKYLIKASAPFRRRQGFLSILNDKRTERKRRKERMRQEKEESLLHFSEVHPEVADSAQVMAEAGTNLPQPTSQEVNVVSVKEPDCLLSG